VNISEKAAGDATMPGEKLNVGCGLYPKSGYINVDCIPTPQVDVVHDLDVVPWPFENDRFAVVEMDHVLEHLREVRPVMAELFRILRPGGVVEIRVPHFSRGSSHWDHKRGFDVSFPLYFSPDISGGFQGIPFEHVSTRLTWFAQPEFKRKHLGPVSFWIGRCLGIVFDLLGNLNLFATSRLFCFWVGGYDQIEFVLRKPDLRTRPTS
jgi:SAM-dependent methyltransferase